MQVSQRYEGRKRKLTRCGRLRVWLRVTKLFRFSLQEVAQEALFERRRRRPW